MKSQREIEKTRTALKALAKKRAAGCKTPGLCPGCRKSVKNAALMADLLDWVLDRPNLVEGHMEEMYKQLRSS